MKSAPAHDPVDWETYHTPGLASGNQWKLSGNIQPGAEKRIEQLTIPIFSDQHQKLAVSFRRYPGHNLLYVQQYYPCYAITTVARIPLQEKV